VLHTLPIRPTDSLPQTCRAVPSPTGMVRAYKFCMWYSVGLRGGGVN